MEYNHFLILFVATRICSSNTYKSYLPIASKLFKIYVQQYAEIYGKLTISSNVHNLVHVVEDLQYCDTSNLMDISTYKFENTLRLLGLKLKHSNRPLEQIVCRLTEQIMSQRSNAIDVHEQPHIETFQPKVFHQTRDANRSVFEKILISDNIMLSSRNDKDSWFITKSKDIVKFKYAVKDNSVFKLFGQLIPNEQKMPYFSSPITSSKLDIFASSKEIEYNLQAYEVDSVQAKMMCLTHEDQFVFIPLLHTLLSKSL